MKLSLSLFDAVAFDFDGTLADTINAHAVSRAHAFPVHGIHDISFEQHLEGHRYGCTTHMIVAGVLKEAGKIPQDADPTSHELVGRIVATKAEYYLVLAEEGFDAHPGAEDFLRLVSEYKGRDNVCIVTNAEPEEVMPYIRKYQLHEHITPNKLITISTVTELGLQPKPGRDPYLLAAERFGIKPSRLLVVEDTPGGVAAGKAAGAVVLAVGNTESREGLHEQSLAYHPDFFAESFADIELIP